MFDVAEAYDRFMGRYSAPLAPQFASFAGVHAGQRVLDVGCGPGALTTELVGRVGVEGTVAVDPSAPFVAAAAGRHPEVDVRIASAEKLPFDDESFDAVLAQLVVHFMADPVAGLKEMGRVTRTDGVAAACVWDHGGGGGPLALFWEAARAVAPEADDESERAGTHEGQLAELFAAAGFDRIEQATLVVSVAHPSFTDWWEPFTLGVGPAGAYYASLSAPEQAAVFDHAERAWTKHGPTVTARAWAVRGRA